VEDLRIEIALSYNMRKSSGNSKVKSLFHQQLSAGEKISSRHLASFFFGRMIKLSPYQTSRSRIHFFHLRSVRFHHKIYVLHDDDYVVIALPFDDVTDNLSLRRRKKT